MNTDSFIIYIKTKDVYEDIANNVKKRFDLSNYEINRSLPNGNKKNVIGLIKDELRETTYSYLIDDDSEDQKAKGTGKIFIKTNT